ncbi:MAG TPA: hypothetical protein VLA35_05895 [Thermoleophilia bacterium]|nr:hypothetical protein [Thermoleophilia bacterium]
MHTLDLDEYRRRAEAFSAELEKEAYLHFSGQKETCDTAAVYERYPELFTRAAVAELNERYPTVTDDPKRQLAYLIAFTTEGYLGAATRHLSDEVANTESRTTIEVDGEQIGLRVSSVVQANEADRERRARIQQARLEATTAHLDPLLLQLWGQAHGLARDLGYPHYLALYTEIRGLDHLLLRAQAERFLQDTSGLYHRVMERLVRDKLGIALEDLWFSDLSYLFRAPGYDDVFTADRLMPTLERTLAGLGVDLGAQANVHLDTEVRELKTPRAFCAPVRVPDEIYLCVLPQGGADDYSALLHEGGHTEHFAHTDPGLPFEYRHLGDNAVTEAFAFLFDHLSFNRRWLAELLDYDDADDYLFFANVAELFLIRRYAAKVAYETELHASDDIAGMAQRYSRRLSDALMVEVPAENYLVDVDPGLYVASYLQAWMLEGAFRMILQDRFSIAWFQSPAAAEWLKELWGFGQHFRAGQLLLKKGGGRLDFDPLRRHMERALGR